MNLQMQHVEGRRSSDDKLGTSSPIERSNQKNAYSATPKCDMTLPSKSGSSILLGCGVHCCSGPSLSPEGFGGFKTPGCSPKDSDDRSTKIYGFGFRATGGVCRLWQGGKLASRIALQNRSLNPNHRAQHTPNRA